MSAPALSSSSIPSKGAATTPPSDSRKTVLLSAVVLVIGSLLYERVGLFVRRPYGSFTFELAHMQAIVRFYIVLVTAFSVAWLLQPLAEDRLSILGVPPSTHARRAAETAVPLLCAIAVSAFLVHFGLWQYGAWDSNILIDVGWRQVLGQRPFVDFVTPTPPFFNWTSYLAFRLFGVRWEATLFLAAGFAALTTVWTFALLRRLGLSLLAAIGTALTIEAAVMLTGCFWWYNNSTLLLAALFYFSVLLLAREPESRLAQLSYVLLLAVLPLTKPNIAGVTGAGCVVLLLLCSRRRGFMLLLTLAGLLLCVALFLALHIPFAAMMATYRGIAKERGGLSAFGFAELPRSERILVVCWTALLCLPLVSTVRPIVASLRAARWSQVFLWLLFPLAAVVAIFGLMGNGEQRDVEMPLLIGALALLCFSDRMPGSRWRRYTVALMCGMAASDLYTGVQRLRVYTMVKDRYFAWSDNQRSLPEPFFQNMRVSETMVLMQKDLHQAVVTNPGPVFFGPRLEFEYAVLGLPSPAHWASFFQPGTAFAREQTPALLQSWDDQHFQTLIFLKDEYIFYPETLLNRVRTDFVRDDAYPDITVYRRRSAS